MPGGARSGAQPGPVRNLAAFCRARPHWAGMEDFKEWMGELEGLCSLAKPYTVSPWKTMPGKHQQGYDPSALNLAKNLWQQIADGSSSKTKQETSKAAKDKQEKSKAAKNKQEKKKRKVKQGKSKASREDQQRQDQMEAHRWQQLSEAEQQRRLAKLGTLSLAEKQQLCACMYICLSLHVCARDNIWKF